MKSRQFFFATTMAMTMFWTSPILGALILFSSATTGASAFGHVDVTSFYRSGSHAADAHASQSFLLDHQLSPVYLVYIRRGPGVN